MAAETGAIPQRARLLSSSKYRPRYRLFMSLHPTILHKTIVFRTTGYSTVTAAPSTIYDIVMVSSVLTEVGPLPLKWSRAPDWSPVSFPNANLHSVLDRYGYAISAHHFCVHAGETYELLRLRGRILVANAEFQTTTLVRAPLTTTEFETQTVSSAYTQVCFHPCAKLVASSSC
jgi:hypothetical protein